MQKTPADIKGIFDFTSLYQRSVGGFAAVILALSAMVGSGIFVLPALASKELYTASGSIEGSYAALWLAYILSGLVVIPGAISKAELSSAMPTSGGAYVYIERTFGPIIGTISGLGLWASFMLKSAFALIGFSAYVIAIEGSLGIEFTDTTAKILAIFILILITAINIRGMGLLKKILTPIILVAVSIVILVAIMAFSNGSAELSRAPLDAAINLMGSTAGWKGLGSASAYVFLAYVGIIKIAAVGEDVVEPERNLPIGMFYSLGIAMFLYAGVSYTLFSVFDGASLGIGDGGYPTKAPMYSLALEVGGSTIAFIIAIFAILTMSGGGLTGLLGASKFPFAMSRDKLLPKELEDTHPKYQTPHRSIYGTSICMGLAIIFLDVATVAKLASGFMLMIFTAVNLCVIIIRRVEQEHTWYQPKYRLKSNRFIQYFGILSSLTLLILMGINALIGAGSAIILGLILYASYGKNHVTNTERPWNTFISKITDNESELMRAVTVFRASDLENNNHLNLREFTAAIRALEWLPNEKDIIRDFFHLLDENNDGVLDIDEFLMVIRTMSAEEE
ncbi:MAG TPA: amino acid permease [Candidatus Thalassarchaeaceae archaeon]|nr:MAG TPA: amino acid permease [Candidatus Poseidoniales archaeon]HII48689.1 amino acid permease [Candidatus Thalassarchaeaceae archaeon]